MRNLIHEAMALAIAASFFGCAEADTADAFDGQDEPALETRDKPGSGGTNGLYAGIYFDYETLLINAAEKPLVDPGTNQINADIGNHLLQNPDGRHVFQYAAACGVPAEMVVEWQGEQFTGLGHLAFREEWLKRGLRERAIEDLLACVAAHMNKNTGVPILLSGPHVHDDGADHSEFWVDEARWTARLTEDGYAKYFVWPNPLFVPPACVVSGDPMDAIKERFCGQNPDDCQLERGDERECDGTPEEGWYCGGQPAIMTSLRESDVPTMYCF